MKKSSLSAVLLLACALAALAADRGSLAAPARRAQREQRHQQQQEFQEEPQQLRRQASGRGAEADEAGEVGNDEAGAVDPEFEALTSDGSQEYPSMLSSSGNGNAEELEEEEAAAEASSNMGGRSGETDLYVEPRGLDSNIANAKVRLTASDMATAAGHHHHAGHYAHGWLEMGAHTGKKGSFGWHDKHPVGGKGRR